MEFDATPWATRYQPVFASNRNKTEARSHGAEISDALSERMEISAIFPRNPRSTGIHRYLIYMFTNRMGEPFLTKSAMYEQLLNSSSRLRLIEKRQLK
jgi:hypothetical protein